MRGMILAAGRGERARPLTDILPKPLLPLNGFPVIAYSLGLLKSAGIADIVVNIAYKADRIREALAPCSESGLNILFSDEGVALETGGGIANARPFLGDDRFVVVNSDVVCDVNLAAAVEDHKRSGADATMVLRPAPDTTSYAPVRWDVETHRILDIRDKTGVRSDACEPVMYTGVQILEPMVFEYLEPVKSSIIDAFYLPALYDECMIRGFLHEGYWEDIGDVEKLLAAQSAVAAERLRYAVPCSLPAVDIETLMSGVDDVR